MFFSGSVIIESDKNQALNSKTYTEKHECFEKLKLVVMSK